MFTAYRFILSPTVRLSQLFTGLKFCPVVNCCFVAGNVNTVHIQYLHFFFRVHCWGAEHRRENLLRKSPLELCNYRLWSNHSEETQFLHPDKKSPEDPKTDESSTSVNPLSFGSRSRLLFFLFPHMPSIIVSVCPCLCLLSFGWVDNKCELFLVLVVVS